MTKDEIRDHAMYWVTHMTEALGPTKESDMVTTLIHFARFVEASALSKLTTKLNRIVACTDTSPHVCKCGLNEIQEELHALIIETI